MIRISTIAGLAVAVGLGSMVHAADPMEKAVKARQGLFQLYSFNLGKMAAMAKGEAEYDALQAQAAADNLVALVSLDPSGLWPEGSDNEAMKGKTRALPTIWSTYPAVTDKHKALVAAATDLRANAGSLDGLKGSLGEVGKACKSCHDDFRAKDF